MPSTRSVPTQLGVRHGRDTSNGALPEYHVGASPPSTLAGLRHRARVVDRQVAEWLRPMAFPCLRVVLGLLFLWFGGLKIAGVSPVKGMVAGTLPWAPPDVIVPALGAVEALLGVGLVTGLAIRLVLPALAAHLVGTFLTFVELSGQMFHGSNPLLLTQNGEFVTKNLVLISATLVLFAHTRQPDLVRVPAARAPM